MSVSYAPSRLSVPTGFEYVLESLAREVLREQPKDIIAFAANYFNTKLIIRDQVGLTDTPLHTQPVHHISIQDPPGQEAQTNAPTTTDISTGAQPPVQREATEHVALEPEVYDTETHVSDDQSDAGSQTGSVNTSANEDEIVDSEDGETTGDRPEMGGSEEEGQSEGSVMDDTIGEADDADESKGQDEGVAEGGEKSSGSEDQLHPDIDDTEDVGVEKEKEQEVGVVEDSLAEKTEEGNLDGDEHHPPESEQVGHDSEGSKITLEDQPPTETQVIEDTSIHDNTEKKGEGADLSPQTEQEGEQKLSSTNLEVDDQADKPQADKPEESQGDKPEENQGDNPEESQAEKPEEKQADNPEEKQADKPEEKQADKPEESQVDTPEENQGDKPEANQGDNPEESQAEKPEESQADNPEESQETKPGSTTNIAEASVQDTEAPFDENQVSTDEPDPTSTDLDIPPSEDQSS